MSKAIHILLIDDEQKESPFIKSFQNKARDFGMKITHFERGKFGLEELRLNPHKYKALILDARCIWDEKQEYPDDKFLTRAVAELERLEKDLNQTYPTAVNTGYIEDFQEEREFILSRNGDIFKKSTDGESEQTRIFEFLKNKIENSEEWRYKDVFEVFDKSYLDTENRIRLIECLRKLDNSPLVKDDFNALRKVLEAVYERLKDKNLVHKKVSGNLEWTWLYLSGKSVNVGTKVKEDFLPKIQAVFPPHISQNVKTVKELASSDSHYNSDSVTNYTYKSAVFALLAILLWFKSLMEKP
jgi:hypothetical protein